MPERADLLKEFLGRTDWRDARRVPLAGDASGRRYERLVDPSGRSVVLMDAPPELGEDIRPFITIADHLTRIGLSAPNILAQDHAAGFLLLEDLGDALFSRLISKAPELEHDLYAAAIDTLAVVQRHPAPIGLPPYDANFYAGAVGPAFEWYLAGINASSGVSEREEFVGIMAELLSPIEKSPQVLALRDFHAENLVWLPDRKAECRVGLLDFQDAILCHPAYDLVSLLQDARRDVPENLSASMIRRFIHLTKANEAEFRCIYALLGVQRNLRIIGVFARLSSHFGKPRYLEFIPRVWSHLVNDLAHPDLQPLRRLITKTFPEPTQENQRILSEQCANHQTP